uniref:Uncharacterized protein n=1 Tax=Ditylenchus dipsaci TaxID=166011 RepID=A0A915EGC1_9BILA
MTDTAERFDGMNPLKYFRKRNANKLCRKASFKIFSTSPIPEKIEHIVSCDKLLVRQGIIVASHLGVQTDLLKLLLSFHPVWLKLGLETVFGVPISFNSSQGDSRPARLAYVPTISSFLLHNLFADHSLLRNNKKLVYGTEKKVITPAGAEICTKTS